MLTCRRYDNLICGETAHKNIVNKAIFCFSSVEETYNERNAARLASLTCVELDIVPLFEVRLIIRVDSAGKSGKGVCGSG